MIVYQNVDPKNLKIIDGLSSLKIWGKEVRLRYQPLNLYKK